MRGLIYRTFSFVLIISIIFSYIYIYNVNPITFENDETNTNKSYCPDYWRYDISNQSCIPIDVSTNIGNFSDTVYATTDQSIFTNDIFRQYKWAKENNIVWNGVSNIKKPSKKKNEKNENNEDDENILEKSIFKNVNRNEQTVFPIFIFIVFVVTVIFYLITYVLFHSKSNPPVIPVLGLFDLAEAADRADRAFGWLGQQFEWMVSYLHNRNPLNSFDDRGRLVLTLAFLATIFLGVFYLGVHYVMGELSPLTMSAIFLFHFAAIYALFLFVSDPSKIDVSVDLIR